MSKKRSNRPHSKQPSAPKASAKKMNSSFVILLFAVVTAIALFAFLSNAPLPIAAQGRTLARISPQEYQDKFAGTASHVLLDVRTPAEFNSGHIANSVNISVESLASRLSEVPKGVPIVVYCRSGNRSATAAQILADAGYTQVYDLGGIIDWQRLGFPIRY